MTERSTLMTLSLQYDHVTGDLTDYFDALEAGQARASRCPQCGDVRMPPRSTCPDDGAATDAIELSGVGRVVAITHGEATLPLMHVASAHSFVLVAMEGANNFMFGRMAEADVHITVGKTIRLAGCAEMLPHPAGAAIFEIVE